MRIIADVGNPVYYGQRACELVKESEPIGRTPAAIPNLKKAISLLALAIAEIELNEGSKEPDPDGN
jgi:hypothetical protein